MCVLAADVAIFNDPAGVPGYNQYATPPQKLFDMSSSWQSIDYARDQNAPWRSYTFVFSIDEGTAQGGTPYATHPDDEEFNMACEMESTSLYDEIEAQKILYNKLSETNSVGGMDCTRHGGWKGTFATPNMTAAGTNGAAGSVTIDYSYTEPPSISSQGGTFSGTVTNPLTWAPNAVRSTTTVTSVGPTATNAVDIRVTGWRH
jgi:hypothetical protein